MPLKELVKKYGPDILKRSFHKLGLYPTYTPEIGSVKFGDFSRVKPISASYGYDRGGPIDRYYIENFLKANAASIQGTVLEIADNEYTMTYGCSKVITSDILHMDEHNPKATVIADLSNAPHIASKRYDCIILTQTLQYIYNYKGAIETCFRILKSGGTLLLTAPGISSIEAGEWRDLWLWNFSDNSIKKLLCEYFPQEKVSVDFYGNVMVAASFLYGLGLSELKQADLDIKDPLYQVIITASATKP